MWYSNVDEDRALWRLSEPWKHYIPIEKDYSNLHDLAEVLRDEDLWEVMRTAAYRDLIENDRFSYTQFVKLMDDTINTLTANS